MLVQGTAEGRSARLQDFVVLLRQRVARACAGRQRSGSVRVGGPQRAHQSGAIYKRKQNPASNATQYTPRPPEQRHTRHTAAQAPAAVSNKPTSWSIIASAHNITRRLVWPQAGSGRLIGRERPRTGEAAGGQAVHHGGEEAGGVGAQAERVGAPQAARCPQRRRLRHQRLPRQLAGAQLPHLCAE